MTKCQNYFSLFPLGRLISGGQTGVDQTALEFAMASGIPCGGWCPAGRRSEVGAIPPRFPMTEASSPSYPQRTRLNIRDSDATLILSAGLPVGGSALTVRIAARLKRRFLSIDLDEMSVGDASDRIRIWLWTKARPKVLNVAGPRETEFPDLSEKILAVLAHAICPEPTGSEMVPWPPAKPKRPVQLILP